MRKSSLSLICSTFLFFPNISFAEEFVEKARVLKSTPVIEKLYAPGQDCRHSAYRSRRGTDGDAIIGALIGGAAGSLAGKGSGKDFAAAFGAVMGRKIVTGGDFTGEELLGALAGGAAGQAIGKGSGKTVATATGAVIGAALGAGMVSRNRRDIVRQCGRQVVSRNVITSYDVEYEYKGVALSGNLPYEPHEYINLIISVDVLEDSTLR